MADAQICEVQVTLVTLNLEYWSDPVW